ncbi:MAG TPA: glycosyltransferase [Candidatus Methylomirabilis sp.]|nr:glycosyltransferase [Candidatus Methylomirabilis sp.]
MDALSVSVVTPTYNRCASLARLLDGLDRQTYPTEQFEVVVVDDGSTDETLSYLSKCRTRFALRIVQQPHRGPAAARNLGVKHARGDILLFLDDDVLPARDLIERHVWRHQENADVVVIGPMLPPSDWPRPIWVRWEEEQLARQYQALLAGAYPCTPRQFYSANASLRRAQFLDAGGFDPLFARAEDVELAYRLRDRRARFVFDPSATVEHFASRTLASWQRIPYQYGRYDVIMDRDKRHDTLSMAARDFSSRHWLGRLLARVAVGRPWLTKGAVLVLRLSALAADQLGAQRCASVALSGLFNLLYWNGLCDELGGRPLFRHWLAQSAGPS